MASGTPISACITDPLAVASGPETAEDGAFTMPVRAQAAGCTKPRRIVARLPNLSICSPQIFTDLTRRSITVRRPAPRLERTRLVTRRQLKLEYQ